MKERSFDEMVAYFNRRVSEMDIAQDYKMELLGMVTALGYKHEKSTIEPRKKGKWIPCENETGEGSNTYKCSACGEIQMIIDGTPKENGWKYCPHCGAKME